MSTDERRENLGRNARGGQAWWHVIIRENWYRDVLTAIAFFFILIVLTGQHGERRQSLVRSCRETNARHIGTIKEITKLSDRQKQGLSAAQRKSLDERLQSTVLIIDQLVPLRDGSINPRTGKRRETCEQYSHRIIP